MLKEIMLRKESLQQYTVLSCVQVANTYVILL